MNKKRFAAVLGAVMSTLAISAFAKDAEGKSMLTEDQKKQLSDRYGEKFVEGFIADLAEAEADNVSAEQLAASLTQADRQREAKENEELIRLREENKKLVAQVDTLSKTPANTDGEHLDGEGANAAKKLFQPNMKLTHNRAYFAAAAGESYTGDTTVDTQELVTEFGHYVQTDKREIFNKLVGQLSSTGYMSTIMTDKFEVQASSANISSVLQSFTPQFTPKGKTKFTPLKIKSYPMKINVSIIPSDVIDDVIGYLYDEGLEPKDMPIVKYIIEKLVKPILDEEREKALAVGVYKEPVTDSYGKYKANNASDVCDGYLTQLAKLKQASDPDVNFLLPTTADLAKAPNIVELMEQAMDAIKPVYKNQTMKVHIDPDLLILYQRQYRAKYPNTKNEDGQMLKVDFTKFEFAEMEGMRGTGAFFLTPKSNFKHLLSRQPQTQRLRMASQDYEAKIYGEWREGVGFWIKEAIFAYLPTQLVTKLAAPSPEAASAQATENLGV